jgi:hypothetical protein
MPGFGFDDQATAHGARYVRTGVWCGVRFDGSVHPSDGLPMGSRGSGAERREPGTDRAVDGEACTQT